MTAKTQAILIDVAEIGAALGSGDIALAEPIISLHQPNCSVELALIELLTGGALIDLWDGHYAEAFLLLCTELGEALPTRGPDGITNAGDPFAIPTDKSGRIGVISAQEAAGLLDLRDGSDNPEHQHVHDWCQRAQAANLSIAMFTDIGTPNSEPCARDQHLESLGV